MVVFLVLRRPQRSTRGGSSAASDVYKGRALNAAHLRCSGLEGDVRTLVAQLAAATKLVEQSRAAPVAPRPAPPLPAPASPGAVGDIRHPSLHRNIARGEDFHSATSLDEWYGVGSAMPLPAMPNLQSLGHAPCPQIALNGQGTASVHAGPMGGPAAAVAPVFNAFQYCPHIHI